MQELKHQEEKENTPSPNFVPPPTPLLKKIGFGTGVNVYHLDRSPCNRAIRSPWALKAVSRRHALSEFQDRIEAEAKILQELKHPNIVGFRGLSVTEDGRKVLAMEKCNTSLGDIIEQRRECGTVRFEPKTILTVIAGLARALHYLHDEKKLLHGDLKSYNVLIKGDFEEVKLCDFGVSMDLESAKGEEYIGTGAWSAPETLVDGPLTAKADIFSLGLIIWEMLTLKTPHIDFTDSMSFSESDDAYVVEYEQHFGETPALPDGLSADYALVVELYQWCTQQDWQLRPSARDILAKLTDAGIPLTTSPPEIVL